MYRSNRAFDSITKSVEEIVAPGEIGAVMRPAFSHLRNGRRGPVMVRPRGRW